MTVSGIRSYFRLSESGIQLIGSAASVKEAFEKADPAKFDILLMDLWLDADDPLKNVEEALKKFRNKPVVMFSGEQRIHYIRKTFSMGVKAYIFKTASKSAIEATLIKVMEGKTVIPELAGFSHDQLLPVNSGNCRANLSKRQVEILRLLKQGCSPKEIAEEHLHLSVSMVDKSLSILRKIFNARTNPELINNSMKFQH